eukprot:403361992
MNVNQSVNKALDLSTSNNDELLDLISEKDRESEEDQSGSYTKGIQKSTQTFVMQNRRQVTLHDIIQVIIGSVTLAATHCLIREIKYETNLNFAQVALFIGIVISLKNLVILSYKFEDKNYENIFMDDDFSMHFLTSTFLAMSYLLLVMSIFIIPLSYTISLFFSFYLFQTIISRMAKKGTIFITEYAFILISLVGLVFLLTPDVIMPQKLQSLGERYLQLNQRLIPSSQSYEERTDTEQQLENKWLQLFGMSMALISAILYGAYRTLTPMHSSNQYYEQKSLIAGSILITFSFLMFPLFQLGLQPVNPEKDAILMVLLAIFIAKASSFDQQSTGHLSLDRKTRSYATLISVVLVCIWDSFQFKTQITHQDLLGITLLLVHNVVSTLYSYIFTYQDEIIQEEAYFLSLDSSKEDTETKGANNGSSNYQSDNEKTNNQMDKLQFNGDYDETHKYKQSTF